MSTQEYGDCPNCGYLVRPCTRRVCLANCAGAVHEVDGAHACPPAGLGTPDGCTVAALSPVRHSAATP